MRVSGAKCPRQQDTAVLPPEGRPLGARGVAKATVAERIVSVCFVFQNSFMSHLPLKNDRSGITLQM